VEQAEAPVAYVRRALVNAFVSSRRRLSSRDVSMWDVPERGTSDDPAVQVTEQRAVLARLAVLPDRQRAAPVLRYLHDLPDADIAAELGCRLATVRTLIGRAMATLRAHSDDVGDDPAYRAISRTNR
jgi:DNA-directed RNA polymerase specialized sigma24 family protein